MTATLRRALALACLAALAACGPARSDPEAEKAKLMETSRAWSRAAAAGDVDAILNYWADDALVLSPGEPPLRGKPEIRAYLERSLKVPGFRIGWEPLEAGLSADGSMGYLIERTEVSVNDAAGHPVTQHFRGVTLWRKQPDGAWRNVVDISNAPPPAQR